MTSLRPLPTAASTIDLRLLDGLGQRLLAEDVAAGLDGRPGIRRMRFGIRVDADDVGLGRGQRSVVVAELRQSAELLAQRLAGRRAATHEADDLELGHLVVRAGMAGSHVAAAGNEHSKRCSH